MRMLTPEVLSGAYEAASGYYLAHDAYAYASGCHVILSKLGLMSNLSRRLT